MALPFSEWAFLDLFGYHWLYFRTINPAAVVFTGLFDQDSRSNLTNRTGTATLYL